MSVLPKKVSWRRLIGLASRCTHLEFCQPAVHTHIPAVLTRPAPTTASMRELLQQHVHVVWQTKLVNGDGIY